MKFCIFWYFAIISNCSTFTTKKITTAGPPWLQDLSSRILFQILYRCGRYQGDESFFQCARDVALRKAVKTIFHQGFHTVHLTWIPVRQLPVQSKYAVWPGYRPTGSNNVLQNRMLQDQSCEYGHPRDLIVRDHRPGRRHGGPCHTLASLRVIPHYAQPKSLYHFRPRQLQIGKGNLPVRSNGNQILFPTTLWNNQDKKHGWRSDRLR